MRILIGATVIALSTIASAMGADTLSSSQIERINDAASVLTEIRSIPDKDIPRDLWDSAACVIVIPSLKKAAFIVGGEYGKGLMSCRHDGVWSAPVFMEMGKAHAATDAQLKAEVLSYSRAQGLFAGIDISGGVLRPDTEDNVDLYGKDISARAVITGRTENAPAVTQPFMVALRRQSQGSK